MASGLEPEGERAEMCPAKDVVLALIETLVDPRLPLTVSINDPLYEDSQKSVARQMHAVVLLYNYYHRKHNPELEFLDFVSFCKLAVMLRPSLIPFMKMFNGNEWLGLDSAEEQLSVTEKAVKDACGIAMSLDASKDVPIIEGRSISKVTVLLVDSKRDNCLLQFGAVTEGVWSLIEKETDESSISQEIVGEEQACKKRKTNNHQASNDDSKLLQLGFDAVEGVIGGDISDLMVLEAHCVYSLSKERSAAQFYMMQCPQPFNVKQSIPLKFLVERLRGPLAEKYGDTWSTTPVVEYFHMLPYVGFISDWLPRKDSCLPILTGYNIRTTKNHDRQELLQSEIHSTPSPQYIGEELDHIDICISDTKISSSNKAANENNEAHQPKFKRSSGGKMPSFFDIFQSTKRHQHVIDELKNKSNILSSAKKDEGDKVDNDRENHERCSLSGPSRGLSQSMVGDDNAKQGRTTRYLTRSALKNDEKNKLSSKIGAHQQRRMNISSAHGPEARVNLKKADLPKSHGSLSGDKKITAEDGEVAKTCNQTGTATEERPRQFEALHNSEIGNATASEDLHNAVSLLHRKRQELHTQICTMEDELALYEHKIERIRNGGEVELARKCIKSILTGRNDEDHSNPQSEKKTKISCTFLPGKSSCEDLEYICLMNNWRLPKYFVRPLDGKFMSNLVVQMKDVDLSSKGSTEASPSEARESAATQMIAKIRDACASTCDPNK